uniref:PGG domain-containing protein n=1 Tax=Oryza rufipogon TaxID=4529 RepID=A0A0E0R7R4_ORYRU
MEPAGCSTDEVTGDRSTLLHIAAWKGHSDLIAQLCRWGNGSLITSVNSSGYTPLHCAAGAGHAGAVEAIIRALAAGANVEEGRLQEILRGRNEAGDTPLHLAARHGHGEAAEALVRVDPGLAAELNGAGVSSLYLAVMSGSVRAVRAILWCRNASAVGPKSQNALHAAVLQSSEMVSLLLNWKPGLVTDLDSNRSSPLHFASSDGDCSIIKAILAHAPPGAAHMQDNQGLSPLHAAALMGHAAAVRLLMQFSPASADVRDKHGRSFLHVAAMKGHASIISHAAKNRMLEHHLNAQDRDGNTPLHLAVAAGEYNVVSKLLSSGKVQTHIMNNAGCTPSDLVKDCKGFYSMVRLVVKMYVSGAQFQPQRQDQIEKWNGQDIMKWRETTSKNLAVVSTLVATVAFSAAFNVPGSYGDDGKAILTGDRMYDAFLVLDTFAVVSSVTATILLVYGRASQSNRSWVGFMISMHFLWMSLNSMVLGFFTAMAAVTNKKVGTKTAMSQMIYFGIYFLGVAWNDNGVSRDASAGNCNYHGACSTDEVTGDRSTLLHIAGWKGHCDLIAQLCRWGNGSLITSVNSSGDTPLHCAAGAGHAGAVEAIIRPLAAANVEEGRLQEILRGRNEAGDTPLHLAARHGHGEAAEALVRVDPGLAAELNGAGVSSLYLAVMSGSVRAIRAILWCRNASAVGPKSQNALHAAVLQSSGDYFVDNLAFYICTHSSIFHIHSDVNESRHIYLSRFINITMNMGNARMTYIPLEDPPALSLLPSPTLPLVVIVGDRSQRCHGAAIPIDLLSPQRNTATSLFVHIANLGQCQRLGMKRMPLPTASSVATMPHTSNECHCHLSTSEVGAVGFDEATAMAASSTIGTVSSTVMGESREITVAVVSSSLEPPLCRRANPAASVASAAISLTAACLPSPLWKPALLSNYDSNKSSPLHFASSDGDCSIIQEMLTHAPPSAAFMLDNEGLSPLHVAALMGHAAIVHLLLQFCPSSADIRDNYGRTFLHAAAMKGHSSIISYAIKKKILEHLLNAQDKEGNTTLHLAVIAGEYKVVSKLLSSGKMQANIMNNAGHTPTDLVKNCKGFYSMVRLVLKLYASGAQFQPQRQDYIDKWNVQDIMKWRETTSKNLAVVSTLVATIAFSAAFNIPGSYGNDGRANLAGNSLYSAFLILDTFSVVTSVMATILLVYGRASRSQRSWLGFMVSMHFLWLSLNSMVLGFFAAIAAVMSKERGIKIAMSQLIYYGMYILTTLLSILAMPGSFTSIVKFLIGAPKERQRHTKRQISRQYPFAIFYIVNAVLFVIINSLAMASFEVARNLSY